MFASGTYSATKHPAFEAIQYQLNPLLFKQLIQAVETLRTKAKFTADDLVKANIAGLIKTHTLINADFDVDQSLNENAYVHIPELDRNHPLLPQALRGLCNQGDAIKHISKSKDLVEGYVDLTRMQVHGVFQEFPIKVRISPDFLKPTSRFTPEETAAIILHEVGHAYTFFQTVSRATFTNFILTASVEGFFKTEDRSERVKLLAKVEEQSGTLFDNREALADSNNKDYVTGVILTNVVQKTWSDTGTPAYDNNASESLADQFAMRAGAGAALGTAVGKLNRWSPMRLPAPLYVAFEAIKVSIFLLMYTGALASGNVLTLYILTLALLRNPTVDTYDKPEERIDRMRSDLINRLKSPNVTPAIATQVQADIKALDDAKKQFKDRNTFYEFVWRHAMPWGRSANDKERTVKALERLANNDFYVVSASLKN